MNAFSLVVFLIAISAASCLRSDRISVDIDHTTGNFVASVGGREWLQGGEVSVRSQGKKYSTLSDSDSLLLHVTKSHSKLAKLSDRWGSYQETSLLFESADGLAAIECRFLELEAAVVFEQHFPKELSGTASPSGLDDLITAFPSFKAVESSDGVGQGYAHWVSFHYENEPNDNDNSSSIVFRRNNERRELLVARGFVSPVYGPWNADTVVTGGGVSGSGVVALYTADGAISTVLSPASGFMAQSHIAPAPGQLAFGIMGDVQSVPAGYSQATVLFADDGGGGAGAGMNRGMKRWGQFMRNSYRVREASASAGRDVSLHDLGYTTDNGMYYYYNTDDNNTATYQDTLTRVYDFNVKEHGVPYRYILLDSWWYERANNTATGGGVVDWSPRADMFPDGGFEYLHNYTGWWVQAHNRYWSDEAIYATVNGGDYEFGIDEKTHGAVPLTAEFWNDLFVDHAAPGGWGLKVYEQDWLDQEMDVYYPAMLRDVSLARQWLMQMAAGVRANNMTLQYCMPYVRHLLQSLEVNSVFGYADSNIVTQARASDDHKPSEDEDQWRIAGQSMLMDALGLAPSKDGWWSTVNQPGNPYGVNKIEPYPALQAMVATISAGPVQVGDGIGYSDDSLIMRSCSKNGRLLQPDGPAMPIDSAVNKATFSSSNGPEGEVWYAPACFDNFCSHYLSVADLKADYTFTLEELQHSILARQPDAVVMDSYWAVDSWSESRTPHKLSASNPLVLPACGLADFHFYTIVPAVAHACEWTLLGEQDKWIGASSSRFVAMRAMGNCAAGGDGELQVQARGSAAETLHVGFISHTGEVRTVQCNFSVDGTLWVGSHGSCV